MTWMRLWPHWWHNLRFCHGRVIEFFCSWRMRVRAIGMQGKHIEKPGAGCGLSWVWFVNDYHQQFARISYATWKELCFRSAPAAPIRMLDRWIYIRMYDEMKKVSDDNPTLGIFSGILPSLTVEEKHRTQKWRIYTVSESFWILKCIVWMWWFGYRQSHESCSYLVKRRENSTRSNCNRVSKNSSL